MSIFIEKNKLTTQITILSKMIKMIIYNDQMKVNTIPVLYLIENVFYPETIIPLVLNDEPSKNLIRDAYEKDQIISLLPTHTKSKYIATAGKIIVLEKREDGTLMAIIQGIERIQLIKKIQDLPYPIYEFSFFADDRLPHVLKEGAIDRLFHLFEEWLNRHVSNKKERDVFINEVNTPKKLVNNIALFMVKDIEIKLIFLESTSLSDRINILDAIFTGEKPDNEDKELAEAIKNFERLDQSVSKSLAN